MSKKNVAAAIIKTMPNALQNACKAIKYANTAIAAQWQAEDYEVKQWETAHSFDTITARARVKDASQELKDAAAAIRAERAEFRKSLPYAAVVRDFNAEVRKAELEFFGKDKKSARRVAIDKVYNAYIAETASRSMDRAETISALAGFLFPLVETEKTNVRLVAARVVPLLGAKRTGKRDAVNGNETGLTVMKPAEFRHMVMLALADIAKF